MAASPGASSPIASAPPKPSPERRTRRCSVQPRRRPRACDRHGRNGVAAAADVARKHQVQGLRRPGGSARHGCMDHQRVGDAMVAVLDPTGTRVRYASRFGGADTTVSRRSRSDRAARWRLPAGRIRGICRSSIPESRAGRRRRSQRTMALMRIPLATVVLDAPGSGRSRRPSGCRAGQSTESASAGPGIERGACLGSSPGRRRAGLCGRAHLRRARPDIGSLFGAQFTNSDSR